MEQLLICISKNQTYSLTEWLTGCRNSSHVWKLQPQGQCVGSQFGWRWGKSVTYVQHCLCAAGITKSLHCSSAEIPLNPTRLRVIPEKLRGRGSMVRVKSQITETVLNLDFTAKAQNTKLNPQLNLSDSPQRVFLFGFYSSWETITAIVSKIWHHLPSQALIVAKKSQTRHRIWFSLK